MRDELPSTLAHPSSFLCLGAETVENGGIMTAAAIGVGTAFNWQRRRFVKGVGAFGGAAGGAAIAAGKDADFGGQSRFNFFESGLLFFCSFCGVVHGVIS